MAHTTRSKLAQGQSGKHCMVVKVYFWRLGVIDSTQCTNNHICAILGQLSWKKSRKTHKTGLNNKLATKDQLPPPELSYQPDKKRLTLFIAEPRDIGRPPRCFPQLLQLPARLTPPAIARALAITHENLDQMRTCRLFNDARATRAVSNTTNISSQYAALHNINIKGHYVSNCDSILQLKPRR